jgi:hypothetical protein
MREAGVPGYFPQEAVGLGLGADVVSQSESGNPDP